MQAGSAENPGAQQSSPLLAQQLSGRPLPQAPNQPVPNQAQQPQQPQAGGEQNDELDLPDNVNELGDLGMGEEDILGMSENFDILEFADALVDLDKMPDNEKEGQSPATSTASQPPVGGQAAPASTAQGQQGQNIRAPPPPPYPGPQGQTPTSKVSLLFDFFFIEQ